MMPSESCYGATVSVARRRSAQATLPPRKVRGDPADTRARLIAAAADVFNEVGYGGTDSNRIARAAGYAPGTFYKHFVDKKQIFLAVYDEWVTREWAEVSATLAPTEEPSEDPSTHTGKTESAQSKAEKLVDMFIAHHRRWSGFRAALRALVATDPEIRDFYRSQRRRQLELLAGLRSQARQTPKSREEHAVLTFTLERAADSLADGEAAALGLDAKSLRNQMIELVRSHIDP